MKRSYISCLFVFILGIGSSLTGAAYANDLQLVPNSLQLSYRYNGADLSSFGLRPYQQADDAITSDVSLAISWDCDTTANPAICGPKPTTVRLKLEAISYSVNVLGEETIHSAIDLGEQLVDAQDIRYRNCAAPVSCAPQNQLITFSKPLSGVVSNGTSFEAWAAQAYANGYYRRMKLTINSDGSVAEDNLNNNTANYNIPDFFPVSGEMMFGAVKTDMAAPYILESSCPGPGNNLRFMGNLDWLPSSNGQWPLTVASGVNICASYALNTNGNAFELFANETAYASNVSGVHGGDFQVTLPVVNLTPSGISPSGQMIVPLPSGTSLHDTDSSGSPVSRGSPQMVMSLQQNLIDDLSQLTATHTGGYLFSRNLPFSVAVDTLMINESSFVGNFLGTYYNQIRPFDVSDSRHSSFNPGTSNGLASNDIRFSQSKTPLNSQLSIRSGGMNLTADFLSAWGKTNFPLTVSFWNDFSVNVVNSELVDGQALPGRNAYYFGMSTNCVECGTSGPALNYYALNEVAAAGLSADGASTLIVENSVDPVWGAWDGNNSRYIYERNGDKDKRGIFYLPGFKATGSGGVLDTPVIEYLMGSRKLRDETGVLMPSESFPLSSHTARLGNYFMPGLNIGPELYSAGVDKQPQTGLGTDMLQSSINIGFGGIDSPDYTLMDTSVAAKYVVRTAGLTGVFNSAIAPQTSVYGYDLSLSRFAFRQVNNTLDPYTWIDGRLQIPGKGGFDVVFSSLSLECSGNIAGGTVVYERCGDQIDNNDNGLVDENCSERLDAWNTSIDLLSMSFEPDNDSAGVCEAQTRSLAIGNTVELKALDNVLGMRAKWSTTGEPSAASLYGADQVLDRPDSPASNQDDAGFAIAFNNDIELKTPSGSNQDGWFAMNGTLGLPFWRAMNVSTRVANSSTSTAAQSIVIAKGGNLFGTDALDDQQTNAEMAVELKASGELDAVYGWGLTNFKLELPVYYDAGRMTKNKRPQFLGRQQLNDLVVMNVNSGINYIDPARTKVSFGASSDFDALAELNVDLHIDLNDPDSIASVDDFLCSALSISGCPSSGPVASLIDDIHSKMNILNIIADAGLDNFLAQGVNAALPVAPFNLMAEKIAQLQSLPEQVAQVVSSGLGELGDQLLYPLTSELEARANDVFNRLPSAFVQINLNINDSAARAELNEMTSQLEQLIYEIDKVRAPLNSAASSIDDTRAEIERFALETQQWFTQANDAIGTVKSGLASLGNACSIASGQRSAGNKVIHQVLQAKNRIEDATLAMRAVELEQFASLLSLVSGIDLSAVANAQKNIEKLAVEIQQRLNIGVDEFTEQVCGTGSAFLMADVIADAEQFLDDTTGVLAQAAPRIDWVKRILNEDRDLDSVTDGGYLGLVDDGIDDANALVTSVQAALNGLMLDIQKELNGQATIYDNLTAAEIQTRLNNMIKDLSQGALEWRDSVGNSFVSRIGDELRAPIDSVVAQATLQVSTLLKPLVAWVPYQNGEQLRTLLVDEIMNSNFMEDLNQTFYRYFTEVTADLNGVTNFVFDQANAIIQTALVSIEEDANELLQGATAAVTEGIPIRAAKVDGYATIVGNELERLHVNSEWTLAGDSDENSTSFNAALDISSWNANGKAAGCTGTAAMSSVLDAVISTKNLPIRVAGSDTSIKSLNLGFTLASLGQNAVPVPVNVFGGISIDGSISYEAFELYDIGFGAGVGILENYLGATASASFSEIQVEAAFLIGKTCNTDVLLGLDAQAAEFISFPGGVFNGAYARGSASIPIYNNGCPLTVGVGADAGAWLLIGPPFTVGGIVGGSAYGKAACIASIRGQVTVFGEKSGDQFKFRGDAFGAAGIGFDCDPETWTSVSRSRNDDWCGTADAEFSATATVKGNGSLIWDVGSPSADAIY